MSDRERIARRLQREAAGFRDPVAFYVEGEADERYRAANPGSDPDDLEHDWALESWLILADAVLEEMGGKP